jgi:hypothetical protein
MSKRILSENFERDLKEGLLAPIVSRVKKDNSLLLCIRNGYINIYYRGGNILKISELSGNGSYEVFFDENYIEAGSLLKLPSKQISDAAQVKSWLSIIPALKEMMDFHLTSAERLEREFQQLVVRENNYSRISNATEYFISDIEFSEKNIGKFDLIGVRWDASSSSRRSLNKCQPFIIEMKYGDDALKNKSGIEKHARDFIEVGNTPSRIIAIKETIVYQFNLLTDLGLIKVEQKGKIAIDEAQDLEVIFILANSKPGSNILKA